MHSSIGGVIADGGGDGRGSFSLELYDPQYIGTDINRRLGNAPLRQLLRARRDRLPIPLRSRRLVYISRNLRLLRLSNLQDEQGTDPGTVALLIPAGPLCPLTHTHQESQGPKINHIQHHC